MQQKTWHSKDNLSKFLQTSQPTLYRKEEPWNPFSKSWREMKLPTDGLFHSAWTSHFTTKVMAFHRLPKVSVFYYKWIYYCKNRNLHRPAKAQLPQRNARPQQVLLSRRGKSTTPKDPRTPFHPEDSRTDADSINVIWTLYFVPPVVADPIQIELHSTLWEKSEGWEGRRDTPNGHSVIKGTFPFFILGCTSVTVAN